MLSFVLTEQSAGLVHFGPGSPEYQLYRDADLRIVPCNPSTAAAVVEGADLSTSQTGGNHWAVAMEHRGVLYYFDTVRNPDDRNDRSQQRRRGRDVFEWYDALRTAAGVTDPPLELLHVADVGRAGGGWQCGLLSAELVRRVVQDHGGDPAAVTGWGPLGVRELRDAIVAKWARAIAQDLGEAYRCPVPADDPARNHPRARAFRGAPTTMAPPTFSSPSASPFPSSPASSAPAPRRNNGGRARGSSARSRAAHVPDEAPTSTSSPNDTDTTTTTTTTQRAAAPAARRPPPSS